MLASGVGAGGTDAVSVVLGRFAAGSSAVTVGAGAGGAWDFALLMVAKRRSAMRTRWPSTRTRALGFVEGSTSTSAVDERTPSERPSSSRRYSGLIFSTAESLPYTLRRAVVTPSAE